MSVYVQVLMVKSHFEDLLIQCRGRRGTVKKMFFCFFSHLVEKVLPLSAAYARRVLCIKMRQSNLAFLYMFWVRMIET